MTAPPYLTAPALSEVVHGFFGKVGGVSTGDHATLNAAMGVGDEDGNVTGNRARIATALGVSGLVTVRQTHGTATAIIGSEERKQVRADAMVARTPGLALTILTADCVPVLLCDSSSGVIGAAHAGWRGAISGILEAVVEAMSSLGATTISAAIGPCLTRDSFEVGPELEHTCMQRSPWAGDFFSPGLGDRRQFDIKGYVRERLIRKGVVTVDVLAEDTLSDPERFFSARASQKRNRAYGCNASCIALAGDPH